MRHESIRQAVQMQRALPQPEVERLSALYPSRSGKLLHGLAGHPLLALDALAEACERMNPEHVECRTARNRNGEGFAFADMPEATIGDTVRNIDRSGRWVMMRFAEQLPEYAELMRGVIDEIEPVVRPRTGEPLRLRAFIFISAPHALTPFHFDPEYNILFQISGRKFFAVYPPAEPWLSDLANERYHKEGDNLLPWGEGYREGGAINQLDPGEALYVPYRSPHWVEVGDEPSVSISLTWCSQASYEQDDAYRFNAWLRRFGISPAPPRALPARSPVKAAAFRVLNKLQMV